MDDNQDGDISRDEASRSEPLAALFNSADDNKDGVLDEEEYDIVHQAILENRGATGHERRRMMTEKGGP